ncbi:MAG: SpaA isopeptide-forming pilin-related protein, partial [Bacilli bacterium]
MKKKILYLLVLFIITSISYTFKIKALNITNLEYIPSMYYTLQITKPKFYYHSDYQPYLKIDNKLLYCIEPEILVGVNKEYNVGNIEDIELSKEEMNKIILIGHYGYDYPNHQNYKYYLASQELIWKITRPSIEVLWSTQKHGVNDSYISVLKEKQEIMNLVNNHNKKPTFDSLTFNLKLNEEIVFTEDILRNFELISTNKNSVKLEDNKLTIKNTGYVGDDLIKLKNKSMYDNLKTEFFTLPTYQSLLLPRNRDEIYATLKIDSIFGKITIDKVDSKTLLKIGQGEASLKGTKIHIYNEKNELITEKVFNDKSIVIDNLPLGTYKIKEIESGKGYLKNETVFEVKITKDNLFPTITLKNDVIKSNVKIVKLYGLKLLPEKGAIFEITDKFNKVIEIKTNKVGEATIDLTYGTYLVHQKKGIKNHKLSDDFIIKIDENSLNSLEYEIINKEIKADIIINKIDSETKKLIIEKTKFNLFNKTTNELIDTYETVNGILKISTLSTGQYFLEEIESSKGYIKSNRKLAFAIDDKVEFLTDNFGNNYLEFNFENSKQTESIKITKLGVSKEKEVLLSNIIFEIYAKDDVIINDVIYYKKDELVETLVTIRGHVKTKPLLLGEYYIKEIKTHKDYILDNKMYDVNLNINNKITIKNQKIEKEKE